MIDIVQSIALILLGIAVYSLSKAVINLTKPKDS